MRVFIFALLGVFVVFCFLGEVGGIAGSQMANRSTDLRADLVETNSANKCGQETSKPINFCADDV